MKASLLSAILLFSLALAKEGGVCFSNGLQGTCQKVANCNWGFTVTGACPNDPADVKCCLSKDCKNPDTGTGGTCLDSDRITCGNGGGYIKGQCPGSATVQCCVNEFLVDGTAIPDVDFDIGESYAGLLPVSSNPGENRKLYFWFFPSENPLAGDEITIWLNGGPGCSSLEGLLQENGPFLWQYGTFRPVKNPFSWVKLTNMVWVEQPVGTGFSQGTPDAKSEDDVASQFLGFFKNFVDTFSLHGRKVYITGESYAGYYIPYIANAMLSSHDTNHYRVSGILMYDPVIGSDALQTQIPSAAFANYWNPLLDLDPPFLANIRSRAASCGYTSYMDKYLAFPPPGPFPAPPSLTAGCRIWEDIAAAAQIKNPCFNRYHIVTTCPLLWDVLGFPGSDEYLPDGAEIYFNRQDVQKAIKAPQTTWKECVDGVFVGNGDTSMPSASTVLPSVIERLGRTIIGQGLLDYVVMANGTLLAIQSMKWNGKQGFSARPSEPLIVPELPGLELGERAGFGIMGEWRTERNLTYSSVHLAGHMVPQYAPSASYRHVEYLLGRISDLSDTRPFTTAGKSFNSEVMAVLAPEYYIN
ncbi:hypothetical protein GP486_000256 [Trichoglossum hirsutum]|uniref:Carboxypeptidase n=1 Tax=Trichoglossum hirsutum TaxID=265104 RepID=A0A9P8LI53_9PEZI|nr:hypothetical protein GP486_000256 [Trichoglossum hirsutum]